MIAERFIEGFGHHRRVAFLLATCAVALGGGCQSSLRDRKSPVLLTQSDAASYVLQVLESPLPDERRAAANRLAQTRYVDDPTVCKALCLVARTDSSTTVRVAAVLALSRCSESEAYETCIEILSTGGEGGSAERAPREVRAIAAENLRAWVRGDVMQDTVCKKVCDLAITLVRSDPDRNVRVSAARLLGCFARRDVVMALIDGLEQRDFGVCYESERSLMRLTGKSFDHDPRAWRVFVAEADDIFAGRGALDDRLEPSRRGWFSRWSWSGGRGGGGKGKH